MEKRNGNSGMKVLKIVLTGAECTAKSTLAKELADHYRTLHVPEYARDYVLSLDRAYDYDDVDHIARIQVRQFNESDAKANRMVFFDTYLVITRVWFDVVFKGHPDWLDEELKKCNVDLYLLCDTDIPWIPDGVRENGGEMRERLYTRYRSVLEHFGSRYRIVKGTGTARLRSAIQAVNELLDEHKTKKSRSHEPPI